MSGWPSTWIRAVILWNVSLVAEVVILGCGAVVKKPLAVMLSRTPDGDPPADEQQAVGHGV